MKRLECQILRKTKKLLKRKHDAVRGFQNLLLEDDFVSLIAAIEEQEEDMNDVLIFSEGENHKFYQETILREVRDLEDFKKRIMNNYEYKLIEYGRMTKEEALTELEDFIEASKSLVDEYFEGFNTSINRLIRKLTVIKHIQTVQYQAKRVNFSFLSIYKNLKNLHNLITVDNAQTILISNIEKLRNSVDEKYQNLLQLIDKLGDVPMEPCYPENINPNCPPISESSNSSDDDGIFYFADPKINENNVQKEVATTSDCFFVDRSSGGTRMDSLERLKTDVGQLEGEIESIEEKKAQIKETIEEKKNEILEALAKVAELEDNIQEIEELLADLLFNFQQRIIHLESKLMENFKGENDSDMKNLLENEILELKESFHAQFEKDEKNLSDLTKTSQSFAASISDIIAVIDKIFDATKINEKLISDIEKLKKLIERPAQFCYDSKDRRFYLNKDRVKIFQDEFHTAHYMINSDGDEVIVKEALPIDTDTNGEFYHDVKSRKIYTKYFFEDDFGHYYIDVHGDRHYKTDAEASEYMLVNGVWVKTAEGTYERDEKGQRIKPAEDPTEVTEQESDAEVHDLQTDETATTQKQIVSKDDMKYIKETIGPAIIKACTATYLSKPSDPLNYFANYLLHYRYTQKMFEAREKELNYFIGLKKQIEEKCEPED